MVQHSENARRSTHLRNAEQLLENEKERENKRHVLTIRAAKLRLPHSNSRWMRQSHAREEDTPDLSTRTCERTSPGTGSRTL